MDKGTPGARDVDGVTPVGAVIDWWAGGGDAGWKGVNWKTPGS